MAKLDGFLFIIYPVLLLFLVFVWEVMIRNFLLEYMYFLKSKNIYKFIIMEHDTDYYNSILCNCNTQHYTIKISVKYIE